MCISSHKIEGSFSRQHTTFRLLSTLRFLRILLRLLLLVLLFLWCRLSLLLSKHISKSKLTHPVAIRNVWFRSTHLACCLIDIILNSLCLFLRFFKRRQSTFSEYKVSFVWVVLNRSSEDHVALLQRTDVRALDKARLEFKLVEEVVPQIMLREYSCITEDDQPVFRSGQCDIEATGIIQKTNSWGFIGSDTRE